ncbi:MAG: hypothetical protein BRC59_15235 [Cyanobacteria bacterium SW_4_48_29]|nr:MAG: hypothetical protein BRC53_10740 [Cyanobacteria bacterium SW_6_48_11]PSP10796.1 MAG: hypothetical protein BRC50_13760 [Cyanobacteria bacterium SW_11_48_12]PSP24477.1 MAG: hypothetical protein BRC55_07150 [Cyanobacteria bacterium SW_8_48_13]PSP25949.1 MAG: hypothetical protein BRC59_15235 [Cyanobacteria bacterium SW_4_48_29]
MIVDLDRKNHCLIRKKTNKEVIAEYFLGLVYEILNQIEEVSIDLWKSYQSVVEELLPNEKVVADRFHVMKEVNEELDQKRKSEKRQAEKF